MVAFSALLLSSNSIVQQFGFLLVVAAAVDTLIVRTVFVPAVILTAVDWNWWPRCMPPVTKSLASDAPGGSRAAVRAATEGGAVGPAGVAGGGGFGAGALGAVGAGLGRRGPLSVEIGAL